MVLGLDEIGTFMLDVLHKTLVIRKVRTNASIRGKMEQMKTTYEDRDIASGTESRVRCPKSLDVNRSSACARTKFVGLIFVTVNVSCIRFDENLPDGC